MKYPNLLATICFLPVLLLSGCTKDDNEPLQQSTVSRLYVSNADTDASVVNTMIFDPADGTSFSAPYSFDSKLPDGNGIFFDPFSGTVFQVSRQAKNIRTLKVNTDGTLGTGGSFIDESLKSAREIAFDRSRNILYVASNIDSAIYVYEKANTLTGSITANKKIKLDGEPWGIHLENDNLFVVIDQGRTEVQLYETASSLIVGVNPTKRIKITGAIRLHGITYSSDKDVLILTDIGQASTGAFTTDGSIYIIDAALVKFTTAISNVNPIRTISGLTTGLGNPVDVALDKRTDKDLIYIAEKANKKILVFKLSNNGNVAPAISATLATSPEAIYLDAR